MILAHEVYDNCLTSEAIPSMPVMTIFMWTLQIPTTDSLLEGPALGDSVHVGVFRVYVVEMREVYT